MRKLPVTVWGFAFAKFAFHIATTRLSFHRDEFYFISASDRLTPSYVDFQPMTPILVRIVRALLGESLLALRIIPSLAGALVIVLAALLARELGGDRRGQTFAAFVALVIPLFVGANSALNTVTLEIPVWMVVALLVARLERTGDRTLWLWIGAAIGVALLVKFTVLAYLAGIPLAILLTPLRRHLRTPWPWLGGSIALTIVAPSLWWQFANGLPVVEFVSNQSSGGKVLGLSGRLGFLASLVIFPGPVGLFVLIPGWRWLWRERGYRAVAVITIAPIVVFFLASGKGYYSAPALAVALTAGAVSIAQRRERVPRALIAGLVVNVLIALPLLVPLVPTAVLRNSRDIAQATEMGERLGWRSLAAEVDEALASLPQQDQRKAIIIGDNYTIPSVMEYYREDFDLPTAVSGHNSAYLWWPQIPVDHVAILTGFDEREVAALYADVERVGTIRNSEGVQNYEWDKPIWVAREPRVSPARLRESLRVFTA